jgi:hypothetical protein
MTDGNDKYRKKGFTRVFDAPCEDPLSLGWLNYFKRDLDRLPERPEESKQKEKILIVIGERGGNLETIIWGLLNAPYQWRMKTGKMRLSSDYRKHSNHLREEKTIRSAFSTLQKLSPVLSEFDRGQKINEKLKEVQASLVEFQQHLNEYLDCFLIQECFETIAKDTNTTIYSAETLKEFPEAKLNDSDLKKMLTFIKPERMREWVKANSKMPKNNTHGIWGESILSIVQELVRIGYANNSAYKTVAQLLKLEHPDIFTDDLRSTQDQVKQRYNYQIIKE